MAKKNKRAKKNPRKPLQLRAKLTVDSILEAAVKILKQRGIEGLTTNRIAEIAGVSVGSVYQYFRDKRAIFKALHDRHVSRMIAIVESALARKANLAFEDFLRDLIRALTDDHVADPLFHELLNSQVPHGEEGARDFRDCLCKALKLALTPENFLPASAEETNARVFIAAVSLESLVHEIALHRPDGISLRRAKNEAFRAVSGYLRSA